MLIDCYAMDTMFSIHTLKNLKKKHLSGLALSLVLVVAAFFRLWSLGSHPPAFHADEVMNAYVGQYILENGVDLYGNPWPLLYFDNFGDYPNVIPMYFSGLFTLIFGNHVWAARLPIALMGILTFGVVYLLGKQVFRDKWTPVFLAAGLALQPWHLIMSRATAEGVTATAVFLLATWLMFIGVKQKKHLLFELSVGFFGLTYFLYPGFRVLVPVFLLPSFLFGNNRIWKFKLALVTLLFFAITIWMSQQYWVKGRFNQTSTFSENTEAYVFQQNFIVGLGPNKATLARILYNKPVMYGRQLVKNYLQYFSTEFLFIKGGEPLRYYVPDQGVIFFSWLGLSLFLVPTKYWRKVGAQTPLTKKVFTKNGESLFTWLMWGLVVSPLPAALTIDDVPNVHRALALSVLMLFPLGYVFAKTHAWRWRGIYLWWMILAGLTIEFGYFWHKYLVQAPAYQAYARQADIRATNEDMFAKRDQYPHIWAPSNAANVLHYLFMKDDFNPEYAGQFSTGLYLPEVDNISFYQGDCPLESTVASAKAGDLIIAHESCDRQIFTGYSSEEKHNYFWWVKPE